LFRRESATLRTHWVMVVMDQFTRRIIGGGANDGRSMHWTPIDGSTLLHLALNFREREIFDWLLTRGADPHARAALDGDGFGGHTPLFNAIVCGPWPDTGMTGTLLERGARRDARASLRKFLDWIANPHWYEARDVTAAERGRRFPETSWINTEACVSGASGS